MPHIHPADRGWFMLDLIVPHAQLSGLGQLRHFLGDRRVKCKIAKWLACFPDVYNLPDRGLIGFAKVADQDRLGQIRPFLIADDSFQFLPQSFNLGIIKNPTTQEESLAAAGNKLAVGQHILLPWLYWSMTK